MLGCTSVYSALFGIGALLYGHGGQAVVCLGAAAVTGIGLAVVVPKIWGDAAAVERGGTGADR